MSNLDLKKVQVDELRKVVDESLSVVAVDYRGTDVPKLTSFRKDAKDKSVSVSYTHLPSPRDQLGSRMPSSA